MGSAAGTGGLERALCTTDHVPLSCTHTHTLSCAVLHCPAQVLAKSLPATVKRYWGMSNQ
jgi:hypothetical protein